MRVASVNVSAGRVVEVRGSPVETGIFKEPVSGRVVIRTLGLDGDLQADRRVHGGVDKAVYAYSADHYPWWQRELGRELTPGMFGENLTIEGLDEAETCVGDALRVGDAVLQAVQPRLPCYKLGLRFGDPTMPKRFMRSARFGIYFRVLEEGAVGAGDMVSHVHRDDARLPVPHLVRLLDRNATRAADVRRALECSALSPQWVEALRGRAEEGAA